MRIISVLLIIAGLVLAVFYPVYQSDHTGTEIKKERVFDRFSANKFDGWREVEARLTSQMNPIRFRLSGSMLPTASLVGVSQKFIIELTGPSGPVYTGELDVVVQQTDSEAAPKSINVWRVSPELGVLEDGNYKLKITNASELGNLLEYLDVTLVANVEQVSTDYRPIGFGMVGAGILLFSLFRKKRRRNQNSFSEDQERRHQRAKRRRDHDDDDDDNEDEDDYKDDDWNERYDRGRRSRRRKSDEKENIWTREPRKKIKKNVEPQVEVPNLKPKSEPDPVKIKKPKSRFKWGRQSRD